MPEFDLLDAGIRAVELDDDADPAALQTRIDRLKIRHAQLVHLGAQRGEHELMGRTPVSWVAWACKMSPASASDRLCVGKQLEELPRLAEAVRSGEIGFQAASVLCHFRDKLGDKKDLFDEEHWITQARESSVKNLRWVTQHVRYLVDPDGFEHDVEEDYEQRYLYLSPMGQMYKVDGVVDAECGAALRAAIDGLAKRLGEDDSRKPKQRRADAFHEIVRHALDKGTLPTRNRVRPHISVHTTIEGLKGELGAAASELQTGGLVSSKTVQRMACDGMLSRVVKAGSVVIDVGRATPNVSPVQWRALKARYQSCGWTGCDRPVSWTSPHHIEFRRHGGPTTMRNLLPLCYHHHRLVHEGGWQVVRAGEGLQFVPPERDWIKDVRRRWGERAA